MIDITHKSTTLRIATAQAVVKVSRPETITAIETRTVPKGDVFRHVVFLGTCTHSQRQPRFGDLEGLILALRTELFWGVFLEAPV